MDRALVIFLAATLQQLSFCSTRHYCYYQPLIAQLGSVEGKGSNYLWVGMPRWLQRDAELAYHESFVG